MATLVSHSSSSDLFDDDAFATSDVCICNKSENDFIPFRGENGSIEDSLFGLEGLRGFKIECFGVTAGDGPIRPSPFSNGTGATSRAGLEAFRSIVGVASTARVLSLMDARNLETLVAFGVS